MMSMGTQLLRAALQSALQGNRDGAVLGALTSRHCVPGLIPGHNVIRGSSLLLVLYSAPRGFSPGTRSRFPLSLKTNISKFQFDPECTDISEQVLVNFLVLGGQINYILLLKHEVTLNILLFIVIIIQ